MLLEVMPKDISKRNHGETMLNRFASVVLIIALGTFGGTSALGQSAAKPDVKSNKTQAPPASATATTGQPTRT
jgi:hypothetical protein